MLRARGNRRPLRLLRATRSQPETIRIVNLVQNLFCSALAQPDLRANWATKLDTKSHGKDIGDNFHILSLFDFKKSKKKHKKKTKKKREKFGMNRK